MKKTFKISLLETFWKIPALWLLIILVSAAYLPFLNIRVLRMAGDEKVYVSQAIEMAREGRWFVQSLAGVPNYFKGPLHYLLLRLGMGVFGNNLFAAVYMNWLFALMGAVSLFLLARRRWSQETALLLGVATALNIGVYSHSFASQMEVELCGFYALAIAALGLAPPVIPLAQSARSTKVNSFFTDYRRDLLFWIAAGLVGWVKSPLHSVLLGTGGLVYWSLRKEILPRFRSPGAWAAVLTGIAIAGIGYAPAYIADHQNFMNLFMGRENFEKPDNGRHWDYVVRSLPHFAFPWSAVVLGSLIQLLLSAVFYFKNKRFSFLTHRGLEADTNMVKLGLGVSLPTILFFCLFPYKGQNYNLPTMAGLLLTGWAAFGGIVPLWSHRFAGVLIGACGVFILSILYHFWPLPDWWCRGWLWAAAFFCIASCLLFLRCHRERALAVGSVCFFLCFGAIISPLGHFEMRGIRAFEKQHPHLIYHYYDLEQTIWSEWGLVQLVTHRPIYGLHWEKQLPDAFLPGHAILVPGTDALHYLQKTAALQKLSLDHHQTEVWSRWLTKGTNSNGESRWKAAWRARDLSLLQREYYIVWLP